MRSVRRLRGVAKLRRWEDDTKIKNDTNKMYIKMPFVIDKCNNMMYILAHENIKKETNSDIY